MNELLRKIDAQIQKFRPDYYSELKKPLIDLEIEKLEVQYNVKLPNDLKELYKWKNGQNDCCYEAFVNNSMFMPLEDVLETALNNTDMIGFDFEIKNWWNAAWLPIFHNGAGDCICYDCEGVFTGKRGQLVEFWHADNDRNVIAPDLKTLFSQLVYYYDKKALDFDEYFEVETTPNYPISFIVDEEF